jgi:hypothetical protein
MSDDTKAPVVADLAGPGPALGDDSLITLHRDDVMRTLAWVATGEATVDVVRAAARELEALAISGTAGGDLIAAERQRQITAEEYTASHDAEHDSGELASAAACYAWYSVGGSRPVARWPWDERWWKPKGGPVRNLVKAGALIVAEIDRRIAAGEATS